MPSRYSIKDLERLSGIKAHTLRIWEQRYDILKPERTETNIRYYRDADLKRILNISLLNNNGYKISKISKLTDEEIVKEVEKLLTTYKSESDQIENLIICLMELDEDRFEKTISNSVIHFGFENTVEKIIFPFLKQLGNMWQVGMITPAQEHFVSNLIRQKIIVGIDQLNPGRVSNAETIVFFLPNGELHELGLLYCHFLAKSRGHRCIYLGQSVPYEDVVTISKSVKPNKMVAVFTAKLSDMDIEAYMQLLHSALPDTQFLVSGRLLLQTEATSTNIPRNFKLFREFTDFKKLIVSG
jgi:DNA-binding transcriptional MerR regulator